MDEELQTSVLTECQMCKEGNFQIIHLSRVLQFGIVLIKFVPTVLGEVKLDLRTAYHAEILFGNITGGHSAVDTHQVVLADSGREAYAIQVDAAVDAHGKVMALFAYLCACRQSTCTC